ncbi:MAG: hypothetical protein M0R33_17005 [Methylomonas sp.]|jgi:hypothetical protein|uniref:hypothetical protein n=1 Tax=Methylomonas sp. TaxID=418 RepID=UPI0025DE3A9D|nr:hypothetical protein [Methylomonas sp.]MCK9608145.1 hypothetical protein [Methylomonas sp.]
MGITVNGAPINQRQQSSPETLQSVFDADCFPFVALGSALTRILGKNPEHKLQILSIEVARDKVKILFRDKRIISGIADGKLLPDMANEAVVSVDLCREQTLELLQRGQIPPEVVRQWFDMGNCAYENCRDGGLLEGELAGGSSASRELTSPHSTS